MELGDLQREQDKAEDKLEARHRLIAELMDDLERLAKRDASNWSLLIVKN